MKYEVERGITITHKQETLEEAAERLLRDNINEVNSFIRIGAFKFGVRLGAKWQQERSYSEEEVINILKKGLDNHYLKTNKSYLKIWFEQFKK